MKGVASSVWRHSNIRTVAVKNIFAVRGGIGGNHDIAQCIGGGLYALSQEIAVLRLQIALNHVARSLRISPHGSKPQSHETALLCFAEIKIAESDAAVHPCPKTHLEVARVHALKFETPVGGFPSTVGFPQREARNSGGLHITPGIALKITQHPLAIDIQHGVVAIGCTQQQALSS